jgi:hypothetical protein
MPIKSRNNLTLTEMMYAPAGDGFVLPKTSESDFTPIKFPNYSALGYGVVGAESGFLRRKFVIEACGHKPFPIPCLRDCSKSKNHDKHCCVRKREDMAWHGCRLRAIAAGASDDSGAGETGPAIPGTAVVDKADKADPTADKPSDSDVAKAAEKNTDADHSKMKMWIFAAVVLILIVAVVIYFAHKPKTA